MATERQEDLIGNLMDELDITETEALGLIDTDASDIEDLSVSEASELIRLLLEEKQERQF